MPVLEKIDGFSNQGRPVTVDEMAPPMMVESSIRERVAAGEKVYVSMMDGKELKSPPCPYEKPEDMPHDGLVRFWTGEDGVQRVYKDGVVVATLGGKIEAVANKQQKESSAKTELTAWQSRRAARAKNRTPDIKVTVGETDWFLAAPSLTQVAGLAGLQSLVTVDESGKPTNMDAWFSKVVPGYLYVLCVENEFDKVPFFKSLEEALEFCDDPAFARDAVALFNCISTEFGDFLAVG